MDEFIQRVCSEFSYESETGRIYRLSENGPVLLCGKPDRGYITARVCGRAIRHHRLAWLLHYKEEPPAMVDHIDGNRLDNRIANLRAADPAINARNRRTKRQAPKGVRLCKRDHKYRAEIYLNDKCIHLGMFKTRDEAAHAYNKAAIRLHGDAACLNPIGQDKADNTEGAFNG